MDNRYTADSNGPFVVYAYDSRTENNLVHFHIATVGFKLFKANMKVAKAGLCRVGPKKFSITFCSYLEANYFVEEGVGRVDRFWRASIPDIGLYNTGIVYDVPASIPINALAEGNSSYSGKEKIHKLERIERAIHHTDKKGRLTKQILPSDKIKIYCIGELP